MKDSVFTLIIQGQLPAHRVYEDDDCIAIMDIKPVQKGHLLVIPKKQIEFIWDLDDGLYKHLWSVAKKIAKKQREVLQCHRVGILVDGESVPHVHIQLIPLNGAHDIDAPRPEGEPDHHELSLLASRLKP